MVSQWITWYEDEKWYRTGLHRIQSQHYERA